MVSGNRIVDAIRLNVRRPFGALTLAGQQSVQAQTALSIRVVVQMQARDTYSALCFRWPQFSPGVHRHSHNPLAPKQAKVGGIFVVVVSAAAGEPLSDWERVGLSCGHVVELSCRLGVRRCDGPEHPDSGFGWFGQQRNGWFNCS